jgi:hypothetical protein
MLLYLSCKDYYFVNNFNLKKLYIYKQSLDIGISILKEFLDNFKKKNICKKLKKIIPSVKETEAPKIPKDFIKIKPKKICKINGKIDSFIIKSDLPEPLKYEVKILQDPLIKIPGKITIKGITIGKKASPYIIYTKGLIIIAKIIEDKKPRIKIILNALAVVMEDSDSLEFETLGYSKVLAEAEILFSKVALS